MAGRSLNRQRRRRRQGRRASPLGFLLQQALFVGLISALWLAGLSPLGVRPPRPELRALAIAYVVLLAIVIIANGKAYYVTPIVRRIRRRRRRMGSSVHRPIAPIAVAVVGVPWPLRRANRPADPPRRMRWSPISGRAASRSRRPRPRAGSSLRCRYILPTCSAGARLLRRSPPSIGDLPPDERAQAVFFAPNYGEAAALDIYGPALGGPPAISGHNSYFLWGPRGASGEVVITLGRDAAVSAACMKTFAPPVVPTARMRSLRERPYDLGSAPSARAARRQLGRVQALRLSAPPPSPRAVATKSPSNSTTTCNFALPRETCSTTLRN